MLYNMIKKLYFALMALPGLISQTIFPYMSKQNGIFLIQMVFLITVVSSALLLCPLIYFRDVLLFLIFNINEKILYTKTTTYLCHFLVLINDIDIGYPLWCI